MPREKLLANITGFACIAGAVVPGKYLRGTPISIKEMKDFVASLPSEIPAILGGWAIRGWRHQGWNPLRKISFCHCRIPMQHWIIFSSMAHGSTAVELLLNNGQSGHMLEQEARKLDFTLT